MNFTSLEYFTALAREKSFTRAAAKLHVTQQTLSAHISQLEKELNCELVVRHVPLALTWAGRVFYKHALRIRKNTDTMKKEIADAASAESGLLRLGISPNREHVVLTPILYEYAQKYPGIHIELTEGDNRLLVKKLVDGDLDLVVAHFTEDAAGMAKEPFYAEEIILLVPKLLLRSLGKEQDLIVLESKAEGCMAPLAHCPFLMTGNGTVTGRLGRRLFAEADITPPVRIVSDNMEMLLSLCAKGMGALFSPEIQAVKNLGKKQLEEMHFIRLAHSKRLISFGYRNDLRQWKPMARFIEMARQMLES